MCMKIETLVLGALRANCYFVTLGGQTIIIDPGADQAALREKIKECKNPIPYVLLTHRHADHLMGAATAKALTGAQVVISHADAEGLSDPHVSLSSMLSAVSQTCFDADITVGDGDTLPLDGQTIRVIATPGHTVGSVCFLIGDALFSGDTLFFEGCGRTDLPTGDFQAMQRSLARLTALEGDCSVYPGHDRPTTLDHERSYNPYRTNL